MVATEGAGAGADGQQKTKVHIVSHSHMDAGWLSTYDDYYDFWVARILMSMTQRLHKNPLFTYTHGDIAFFKRFYLD